MSKCIQQHQKEATKLLKALFNIPLSLDIKVFLNGNLDQLDEIARNFNESLRVLEEKKKESMRKTTTGRALPPIADVMTPSSASSKKQLFYTSRPVSAITNRSLDSKDGLYTFAITHFSRGIQSKGFGDASQRQLHMSKPGTLTHYSQSIT